MSWELLDENRWEWTADDQLHLLLEENGELRELHVLDDGRVFVHIYTPPLRGADVGEPLTDAEHVRTWVDAPDTVNRDDRDAWWRWLAEEGYVQDRAE
jgi:hypothetical protein